jgi:hypothetical protein
MGQSSVMLLLHYTFASKNEEAKEKEEKLRDGTYLVEGTSGSIRFWSRFLGDLWLLWVPFCGNLALEWVPALAIRNCELHSPMKYESFFGFADVLGSSNATKPPFWLLPNCTKT